MRTARALSWLVAVLGLWEILAPFVLGYSAERRPMWNAIILGVVLIALAIWSAVGEDPGTDKNLDWVNALLGLWIILAPFVLGYSDIVRAMWNDVAVGAAVIILDVWAAFSIERHLATQS